MNALTVARKELRALFQSPIAMMFLSVFLVGALFLFFTEAKFFARNLADARPLFQWLPVLLIFLVSAVTMRSWAEERKAGTLEVLLTLPVRTSDLVIGKFLAGISLVGLGLLFTFPIPLMVSMVGPLDWGPVIGGYFAAILLGSAYMAIGLCVSSRTDNQVVALMVTLVLGGVMYLIGTELMTGFFSQSTGEWLRLLGTGSRFESIERGVLDLRDIVYYGSITTVFLVLNVVFLERERLDPGSSHGRTRSTALMLMIGLVAANAVAANVWLTPVHRARVDLTAGGDYSISPVTRQTLAQLDEPLHIRGLFSERTHPLLAPLVPQIRDMLTELEIAGDGKVQLDFADPSQDEELEAELNERYSIKSVPFGVSDTHSQSVVNAYFDVLITYGDQFEVLSFGDLVEIHSDPRGVQVKLKNLEYDLTRTIRRVSQDFVDVGALVAKLPGPAKLTLFAANTPDDYGSTVSLLDKVSKDIQAIDPARVTYEKVDPTTDPALQQKLSDQYGIRPIPADIFGTTRYYLQYLIEVGDEAQLLMPRIDMTQPEIENAVEAAFRRVTPGQLKKVALLTEEPKQQPNPQLPPNMQMPPPPADYRYIEQVLGQNYQVTRTEAAEGYLPEDIDVVVVGKVGKMSPKQQFALDQFLMRGGSVVALAGAYRVEADQQGIKAVEEDRSLATLLGTWGVTVEPALVLDPQNAPFPIPVQRSLPNGMRIREIQYVPYPFFPDLRGQELNTDHATMAGVTGMTMPWASPLQVPETLENREWTWLAKSSPGTTTRTDGKIDPDRVDQDGPAWDLGPTPGQVTLAVAVSGRFPSYFADKPNPTLGNSSEGPADDGRTLKSSVADGRLVVVGSSELTSDLLETLAQQTQSEAHAGNLQLLQNVIDWTLEDTDLLSIRTAGAYARTLDPMEPAEAQALQIKTWLGVLFPVLLVVLIPVFRRRNAKALPMVNADGDVIAAGGSK
ncbi:MAG: Gldg family protein [Myxococcales bacterium]|nr:Gldg family protein [Myxococcales bacterium]